MTTQPDAQAKGHRLRPLDAILRIWALLGFACAAAIIVLLAFGVLGTWGLYLGSVAVLGAPAGFFALARRGPPVRMLPLLLPFATMLAGSAGLLISSWTLFILTRH